MENRACLLLSVLFIQTRTNTSLNARSHVPLTQGLAANLAWRKHGLQLNGGSDAAPRRWEGRAAAGRGHVPRPPKKPRDNGSWPKEKKDVLTIKTNLWMECQQWFCGPVVTLTLLFHCFFFSLASALCPY